VMEIAGILGEKHAFDGTASKGLGTHTHFLRTRKTSRDFAAELRRDFGKLRVSANDRRGAPARYPCARVDEVNALRPTMVRCQARMPGRLSRHLHSTQPRT
jgi:hypothetical protein